MDGEQTEFHKPIKRRNLSFGFIVGCIPSTFLLVLVAFHLPTSSGIPFWVASIVGFICGLVAGVDFFAYKNFPSVVAGLFFLILNTLIALLFLLMSAGFGIC